MTGTKTCTHCKQKKPLDEFYKRASSKDGLMTWCKDCYAEWAKEYYRKNKDKISKKHKEYNATFDAKDRARQRSRTPEARKRRKEYEDRNQEVIRARKAKYYAKNRERILKKSAEYKRNNLDKTHAWAKKYRENHKAQIAEYHRQYREKNREMLRQKALGRLHNDPLHKVKEQTRNMIRCALRSKGHKKTSSTKEILGCDLDFFFSYLKKTWLDRYGTPWEGEPFHIDHITPLATASTKKEIIKLCHYTNLQMLTPEDNMNKHDSLDWEQQ